MQRNLIYRGRSYQQSQPVVAVGSESQRFPGHYRGVSTEINAAQIEAKIHHSFQLSYRGIQYSGMTASLTPTLAGTAYSRL